jgi:hypothetical protein
MREGMMDVTATDAINWFADLRIGDRPTVGGKGASLGELTLCRHRCSAGLRRHDRGIRAVPQRA